MLNQVYNTVEMPDAVSDIIKERQAPAVHTLRCRASLRGGFALGDDMEEKRCSKCEDMHPIEAFCKHKGTKDGLSSWCRRCREISRNRYRQNYPTGISKSNRKYRESHKGIIRLHRDKWRDKNYEKHRAEQKVYRAVKNGTLVRAGKCEECAETENIQAHHDDYSKPLEVRWFCPVHHSKADRERLEREAVNV